MGGAGEFAMRYWRRGRDSNPRYTCAYFAFRVRRDRPLCHLSAAGGVNSEARQGCQPLNRKGLLTRFRCLGNALETLLGQCARQAADHVLRTGAENLRGASRLPALIQAAFRASIARGAEPALMAMVRGFRASGISRFSEMCRSPLSMLAPTTST